METETLKLPVLIASRVDVGRLLREAQGLDEFLNQAAIREPGTPVRLPKTSRLLDEFISQNNLNPLHEADRKKMIEFLTSVRSSAPVIHMSFSTDPSSAFVFKMMEYLRSKIHPLVLLQVGLQPNIGAGAVVRTTNKHYDFSLRQHLKAKRNDLVDRLHSIAIKPDPNEAAPAAPAAVQTTSETKAKIEQAEAQSTAPQTPEQLEKEINQALANIQPEPPKQEAPHA